MEPLSSSGDRVIGKYRLEELIGEGGMATVWRARHITLDRLVAVKFIHLPGSREKVRDRFLREARVAAAVDHRNVVDIIDFGTDEHGDPYMVMEYLQGETLEDRLRRRPPMSFSDVIRVIARTLSGLAAVHEAGIVHRDIKPGNIFLVRDADGIYPKLLDFGVSRAVTEDLKSVVQSQENVLTGTPKYMSPEQARGLADIDHRVDIYAMGTVLYEALAGRPAYQEDRVVDLIMQIVNGSHSPLTVLRPDLGDALPAVVSRAMAVDPEERFQAAREMRQALLAAAAATADSLNGGQKSVGGRVGDSVFPVSGPADVMSAVGDALEPGESGVLASTLPGPHERSAHTTISSRPEASRPKRWSWILFPILAFGGAGLLAFALAMPAARIPFLDADAQEPEPPVAEPIVDPAEDPAETEPTDPQAEGDPATTAEGIAEEAATDGSTITVTLEGVPADAEIRVDGELRDSATFALPRADVDHEIEVTARRRAPWTAEHNALEDGTYPVRMRLSRRERIRRAQMRGDSDMLFDSPGF